MPATFRSALSYLRFLPQIRRASSPQPRLSDRGAPYFIYPAQRHRASARAKALYGALIPRGRDDLRVVRKLQRRIDCSIDHLKSGFSAVRLRASTRSNFQVCSLLPQVFAPEPQCQLAVASIVRSGSTATDTANTASHMGGTTSASSVDSLPSQPFITPLGASLFLHLPRGHPVQSPFASLRANLRFTPDSFHSLPLRRGSEASTHCRASSGLPTLSPLLLLYFQLSHTSNAGPTSLFTLFIFS